MEVREVIEYDGTEHDLGSLTVAELRAAGYDPLANLDRTLALACVLRRTLSDDEIAKKFDDHPPVLSATEIRQVVASRQDPDPDVRLAPVA